MITDLELQALFVIHHQGGFSIDLGHVQALRILFGDINKTRLKLFDQFRPEVAQHKQGMCIQIADCQ
ncbi:hypothetical protein D3C79_736050 [compost metagenome]